jgi:hypothetical protein
MHTRRRRRPSISGLATRDPMYSNLSSTSMQKDADVRLDPIRREGETFHQVGWAGRNMGASSAPRTSPANLHTISTAETPLAAPSCISPSRPRYPLPSSSFVRFCRLLLSSLWLASVPGRAANWFRTLLSPPPRPPPIQPLYIDGHASRPSFSSALHAETAYL